MKDGLSVLAGTGMAGSSVLFLVSIELQHCHISGVLRILRLPVGTKPRTSHRTPSIAWRRERWKEEALDDLP